MISPRYPFTLEELRSWLDYDPETGVIRWKGRTGPNSKVNIGAEAGWVQPEGNRNIRLRKRVYEASQLAWLHYYGEQPPRLVHLNRQTHDNRIVNLAKAETQKVEVMTQAAVKAALDYNPETGEFTWRVSPKGGIPVGTVAGTLGKNGHRTIHLAGKLHLAARLAFLWMTGKWPRGIVNHWNGNALDCRWENLKDTNRGGVSQNTRRKAGQSGMTGVHLRNTREANPKNPYTSAICINGRSKYLGVFPTPEAAQTAYATAKAALHKYQPEIPQIPEGEAP
jgi:hypothetical protein